MSFLDNVATVSVLVAGYWSMSKYIEVLRQCEGKAEQDLVRAWDALLRSYQAEKELEEMKDEAAAIEKQKQQFEKKWSKFLPGKKE